MSATNRGTSPEPTADGFSSPRFSLDTATGLLLWFGVLLVGGYHLGIQWKALWLTEPMGSWETVYASIARAWPDQYQWAHWIDGHDGYGPGYPTLVQAFLRLGFEGYFAHRLVNLLAILLACGLVARMLHGGGCSRRITAAVTTLFYALNAGSYSIQARPDFLVLLEITAMLALGHAAARGGLRTGWRFGMVLGGVALAAFLTKAYSAFTWAAVLAYLAVFVNWRGALAAATMSGAMLAGGIAIFAAYHPLYVLEVFRGQLVQTSPSFAWLLHQAGDFSFLTGGVVAAIVWPLVRQRWKGWRTAGTESRQPLTPVAAGRKFWLWQTGLAAAGLLVGPGWHAGAYLTYFLHLLLVPMAMLVGSPLAPATPTNHRWLELALAANLAVLIAVAPGWPRADASWAELRQDILHEPGRVAVDYLMEPIAREKSGILVVSTGQTGYVLKEPFRMAGNSDTVTRARAAATEFIDAQVRTLFGEQPVDTLYLDCLVDLRPGTDQQRFGVFPRNELPYFTGAEMNRYAATKVYHITPYYFATNAPRQEAGVARTSIVKFVRKK